VNKKNKILIVCINGDSSKTGFAVRVISIARSLIKNGYEVSILKFYPILKNSSKWKDDATISDLNVFEVPVLPISKYSIFRKLSFIWGGIIVKLLTMLKSISLVQAECHEAGYLVLKKKWDSKLPVVVDFHGAAPEEAIHRNKLLGLSMDRHLWLEDAEKCCLEKASSFFYVSINMYDHLLQKHRLQKINNTYLVPVNVEEYFFKEYDRQSVRESLGVSDDDILFIYSGGAQEYQCVNELITTYKSLKERNTKYKLLVLTLDVDKFKAAFDELAPGIADVIYRSANKEDVPAYLSSADLSFLLRREEILNIVSCPTKFGEYLACGVPVVTTKWAGHAPQVVEKYNVGVIVDPTIVDIDVIEQFATKIDNDLRKKCRNVAKENLVWETSEQQILNCYKRLRVTGKKI